MIVTVHVAQGETINLSLTFMDESMSVMMLSITESRNIQLGNYMFKRNVYIIVLSLDMTLL